MDLLAESPRTSVVDEDISLAEYMAVLRRGRWRALAFVVACTLAGLIAGLLLPRKYTAVIVVTPVMQSQTGSQLGGLSGLASEFGGLASLAGISFGQDAQRAETLAVLESSALTERYMADNHLLPLLYPKRWDAKTGRWNVSDPRKVPTLWKADQYFGKKVRTISTDTKTGIVTMKITWTDPNEAAEWANGLVAMTNDYLRAKAIAEAQWNIDYLTKEAGETTILPVRQVIYNILETQIDKEMLARGSKEYALKILDPAEAPQAPSSLGKVIWVALGLFGGIGLSLLWAFLRISWSRSG
jgi:uncharacterized protein involved in exopolysaccharide biosynthesis